MDLTELLKFVTKKEASDLHLKPGRPPLLRVNGRLVPLKTDPLSPKEIEDMVLPILTPYQRDKLQQNYAVDIGYGITGVARFRGNIYLQRGTWTAVFRRIPYQIPQVSALNLPEVIETFADLPAGLVLVTGPTGSGKSTTLAAMVKLITERHPVHIVTIEDPIEYLFQDNMASVSQREMGTDTVSFPEALRNVMRQDPDVIMVGEMRDWETMSTAITAAETGHLVYSTLHTNSASQTIDRIMDSCPPAQQNQVRRQLALVLRAIISMQLIDRVDGKGLVPVVEILLNSPKIAKQIETGETKEIHEEIETSVAYFKMQSMNQSLIALLVNGAIDVNAAMKLSSDPEDLSLKLRKLFPKIEERGRGGIMAPSANDFSAITELMDVKRLYEEQEEKWRQRLDREGRAHRVARVRPHGAGPDDPGQGPAGSRGRERDPEGPCGRRAAAPGDGGEGRPAQRADPGPEPEAPRDGRLRGRSGRNTPDRLLQALTRVFSQRFFRRRAPADASGRDSIFQTEARLRPSRTRCVSRTSRRNTVTITAFPGSTSFSSRATSSSAARRPSRATSTSPGLTPARWAGPPSRTSATTSRPFSSLRLPAEVGPEARSHRVRDALLGLGRLAQPQTRDGEEPREIRRRRCRARSGRRSAAPADATERLAPPPPRKPPAGSRGLSRRRS